jgi:hypothetical protein
MGFKLLDGFMKIEGFLVEGIIPIGVFLGFS